MRECEVGIKREKSALDNFAEKYIIDEKLEFIPIDFFGEKAPQLKEFFRNHRNIKIKIIMVCLMEQQTIGGTITIIKQGKAYFQSQT